MGWFRRSGKVRVDQPGHDLLVNAPDGWLSNSPRLFGSWDAGGRGPHDWWEGEDRWDPAAWSRPRPALIPAVTRCTQLIVSPVTTTPWRLTRNGEDRPLPLWITDPMLAGTVPGALGSAFPAAKRLTRTSFWQLLLTHALWWGRAPWGYVEGVDGQPIPGTLRAFNPFAVTEQGGRWRIGGGDGIDTDEDGRFTVGPVTWRLRVTRGLAPHDDRHPGGVLLRHFDTFRLGATVAGYVASTFSTGVPSGFLKVTQHQFDQDDADRLKAAWEAAHGGDRRSVAVLSAMVDYTPVSITPVDADAEKMHQLNLTDVAHAFGLSSAWLDLGAGGLTYSTLESRRRDFVDLSLRDWGQNLCEDITSVLPYGQTLAVDWAQFTSPDWTTLMPTLAQAVTAGIITVDEARGRAGLPRLEN